MLQWKAWSMWEKKRDCHILSGCGTNQVLRQHGVSLLALSVSWADIFLYFKNTMWVSHRVNLLKGSFTLLGKYASALKIFLALVSMISISREIFSRRPCWFSANKKFVYLQKRNKGTFVSVFVCKLSSTKNWLLFT